MYTLWVYSENKLIAHWRISKIALENRMKAKGSINSFNEIYSMFRLRFLIHNYSGTNTRDYSKFLHSDTLRLAVKEGEASFENLSYVMRYK